VTEEKKALEKEPEKAKAEDSDDEREDRDEGEESEEESEDEDESDEDAQEPAADKGAGSRRLKLWLLVAAAIVVAMIVFMRREPSSGGAAGTVVNADITLLTSDKNDVDCAAPKGVDAYHCGFTDPKAPFQVDEAKKLRPYFTVDRRLFLVPGLFQQPALDQRVQSEPPNKPRDQLKRFTARCKLKLMGELDNVRYRWTQTADWSAPAKVQVAEPSDCKIEG
jgi:hypothetical protein